MVKIKKFVPGKDYSRNELMQLIRQEGWIIESKGADGHLVCRKEEHNPFDLPTDPGKKTKQKILKLGLSI